MRTRPLGPSGIEASVVAFGAWAIGGWMWGGAEEDESIRAIRAALDAGINFIDTAPIYGYGRSETIVGKVLAGRRDSVVLATKCGMRWDLEEPGGEFYFHGNEKGVSQGPADYQIYKYLDPASITYELEQSLRRLQTDYIDLYQTHWQEDTTPIEDTMACLLKLKDQGKIRAIGASNCTVDHLKQYGALDVDQEPFSMVDREKEEAGLLDYCREQGLALLAYSPLARGLLTGKMTPDRQFGPGDHRQNSPRFAAENLQRVNDMLAEFKPIAAAHDATLPQLVIAWTLERPGVTHALCGARSPEQAQENAAAGTIALSDDEIETINGIIATYDIV